MSLINDALKKAQRLRNEDQAGAAAPTPAGGAPIPKRRQARSANTMVLIGSGAVVLVVLSVVVTVYLVNRPNKPVAHPPATAVKPATDGATTPGPTIVAPTLLPPNVHPSDAATATQTSAAPGGADSRPDAALSTLPAVTAPAPTSTVTTSPPPADASAPTTASIPTPDTTSSTPAASLAQSPAAPSDPTKPDERATAFVEAIRVTGIRSSGNESRVLMNDRVYRVNDIVDRTLGIRLVKVATDSLTFADANGVTYVKYF